MTPLVSVLLAVAICLSLANRTVHAAPPPPIYEVGAAKVDITPEEPILLSGYAARGLVEVDKVEQRLWTRAIAIGGRDEEPVVLISVDNCGVPIWMRQQVAKALAKDGIAANRLVVSSTHTHSAPMLSQVLENLVMREIPAPQRKRMERYTKTLTAKMIDAARQALKNRRPAQLAFARGQAGFAANRRTPGGPTDHDVPVLRATDEQGRVLAVVVGYACHCTALPDVRFISGDWAGYSSDYLEQAFSDSVCLTIIGCGADQNPSPRGKLSDAQQHGRAIAEEVRRIVGGDMRTLSKPVSCNYKEIRISLAEHPPRAELERRAKADGIVGHHARQMLAVLDRGEKLPSDIPYPVQSWTFGDELAMVFLADEVVVDYSLRLKRELDGERLWVSAYCNDQRCYIPSERVLAEGGYEGGAAMVWYGWPSPFAPGLERAIVAEVRRQVPDEFSVLSRASPCFLEALKRIDAERTGGALPLPPDAALGKLRTHDNLRVELVAAEPLVIDPVAIDWAADGSLWAYEISLRTAQIKLSGRRSKFLRLDFDNDGEWTFLTEISFSASK